MLMVMSAISLTATSQTNVVSIEPFECGAGKAITIPVCLKNQEEVVALQLKLDLPFEIDEQAECRLSDRSNGHSISMRRLSGNTWLFVLFSASNKPLRGNSGEVFYISAKVPETYTADEEYAITCSQQIISNADGNNICNADFEDVRIRITDEPRPDIKADHVCTSGTAFMPGDKIGISWLVSNIGNLDISGSWKENVSLVSASGDRYFLGTMYHEGTLQAGTSIARQADFNITPLPGIGGNVNVEVAVVADKNCGELPTDAGNNIALSEEQIELGRKLTLELPISAVSEKSTAPIACKLYRSGSWATNQTFSLSTDGDTRLLLPNEVSIKAGQSGAIFYMQVKDNDILDKDSTVYVKVWGNDYSPLDALVTLEDDEQPKLSIEMSKNVIGEGDHFTLTVQAERIVPAPLTVYLSCDYPKRFTYPSQIVLPQGSNSASVDIIATDDNLPDVTIDATFTATAERHESGEGYIMLNDNDIPEIELILTPQTVSESAGSAAIVGKVRRTTNKEGKVTVILTDNSNGELIYSTKTLILEAGVEENMFTVGVKNNNVVDEARTYDVTASVYISSCNCSTAGTTAGTVSQKVTVLDDDGPSLSLKTSKTVALEGTTTTITLSRNTSVTEAVSVLLSSNNDESLEYEHTISFPVGAASVEVPVIIKKNSVAGDDRTVTFSVAGEGFSNGTCWLMITDRTLPDASIQGLTLSSFNTEAKGSTDIMIKVANEGDAPLPVRTKVSVYFNGYLYTSLYTTEEMASGASEILSASIDMPDLTGNYTMKAVVNESQTVKELFYGNNSSEQITVCLLPRFTATVSSDKQTYVSGETIVFKGQATGSAAANTEVDIYVLNAGYRHVIKAKTDASGAFTAEYTPYTGQIGHFTAGACYPNEKTSSAQAEFDVMGFEKRINGYVSCETLVGETHNGGIYIYNPSSTALTGITAQVVSSPANCDIDIKMPETIQGYSQAMLSYTLTGHAPTSSDDWETLQVHLTSSEGVSTDLTVYYYCRSPKAELKSTVSQIKTTMAKGKTRDYSFVITNTGKGETGKISFALPKWMSVATGATMASLSSGQSATVILRFAPTEDMQLNNPVTGRIGINAENGDGIPIDYSIEPVSDVNGTLTIDVCDEYTYNTAEAPHVEHAEVVVQHPTTGAVIANGTTDAHGIFSTTLPEGYYSVSVKADKHDSYKNNLLVSPATETKETVNLSCSGISVDMKYEETSVKDVYTFKQSVVFETNVPVPQVVLSIPEYIPVDTLSVNNSLIFMASLTNEGLIEAQDVELLLPGNLNTAKFTPVNELTAISIAPHQTVIIPVRVTKTAIPTTVNARTKPIDNDPCVNQIGTLYYWDCGSDRKMHRYGVAFRAGSCDSTSVNQGTHNDEDNDIQKKEIGEVPRKVLEQILQGAADLLSAGSDRLYELFPQNHPFKDIPQVYEPTEKQSSLKREDKGCEPCQNKFLVDLASCIPAVKAAIKGAKEVKKGAECIGVLVSDETLMNKMRQCPYSKGIVEGLERFYNTLMDIDRLVKAIWDKDVSEEEYKAIGERMLDMAGATIDYYVESGSANEKERKLKEIIKNIKTLTESGIDLKRALLSGKADYAQAYTALQNVNASLGFLMETSNVFPELAKRFTNTGKFLKKYSCIAPLLEDCNLEGNEAKLRNRNAAEASALTVFKANMSQALALIEADEEITKEIFGDEIWLDIPESEMAPLKNALYDASETLEHDGYIRLYKPKEVTDEQFEALIERWNNSFFPDHQVSGNAIDTEKISSILSTCNSIIAELEENGKTDIEDLLTKNLEDAQEQAEISASSVCSSVSLQFSQDMSMTRQAFRGTLTVVNGHDTESMKNVKLNLFAWDDNGINANSKMQITVETLNTFVGDLYVDSGWELPAQATGVATILFIPTKYAAEKQVTQYTLGGDIVYTDPFTGLEVTRALLPTTINVNPTPNLNISFFVQRDIFADDPLTEDVVEASIPAEFSVLFHNIGYGDAQDVSFNIRQPQIVSNDKGLAADMHIISSSFNGEDKPIAIGETTSTEIGTIPAQEAVYAQWWLKSSLLGHFTDYKVEATHITSYGNDSLSLLNDVSVHELVRSIKAVSATGESIVAFLVNDIADAEDLPDMLHLSDGTTEQVDIASSVSCKTIGGHQYILTLSADADSWIYACTSDPTMGQMTLSSVCRSDGTEIDSRNFWQTNCTLRDGKEPLYENRLHIADKTTAGSHTYILTFVPNPDQYEVAITVDGNGGSLSGATDGIYDSGTVITLVAVPDEGYILKSWIVNNIDAGCADILSITVEQDMTIKAVFEEEERFIQQYELSEGWNWISHGLKTLIPVSVFNDNAEQIIGQTKECANTPGHGFSGNLTVLQPLSAYKVKMSGDADMTIDGYKLNDNESYIDLYKGWNWIGCPADCTQSLADAFSYSASEDGDVVCGQDGYAIYEEGEWKGTLDALVSGYGYLYKSVSNKRITYNNHLQSSSKSATSYMSADGALLPVWSTNKHKYPNTMNITSEVYEDQERTEATTYSIGAFCGEECRGIGKYVQDLLYLTVYGENGEYISFKAIDNNTGKNYDIEETEMFVPDVLGSRKKPYSLHIAHDNTGIMDKKIVWHVTPAITSDKIHLSSGTGHTDEISIISSSGCLALSLRNVPDGEAISLKHLSSGVYIIIMKSGGQTYRKKITKY